MGHAHAQLRTGEPGRDGADFDPRKRLAKDLEVGLLDLKDFWNRLQKKTGTPILQVRRQGVPVVRHPDDVPHDPVGPLLAKRLHQRRVLGADPVGRSGTAEADRLNAKRLQPGGQLHHLPGPHDPVGSGDHQRAPLIGAAEDLVHQLARIDG